jgi:hypothetical protein
MEYRIEKITRNQLVCHLPGRRGEYQKGDFDKPISKPYEARDRDMTEFYIIKLLQD